MKSRQKHQNHILLVPSSELIHPLRAGVRHDTSNGAGVASRHGGGGRARDGLDSAGAVAVAATGRAGTGRRAGLVLGQTQARGNLVKDVDVAVGAAKDVLAGAPGVDGDVGQRVHADSLVRVEGAVDDEAVGAVAGVGVVLVANLDRRVAGTLLVDAKVLADVGVGGDTTGNGVTGLPVGREVGAGAVGEAVGLVVLRKTRLLVGANGTALAALVGLVLQVLGIGRTVDTAIG